MAFRNKFYCRRMDIYSFITHYESYSNQRQILMHVGNYQQLYHTFVDFYSSQEQILMSRYFLK